MFKLNVVGKAEVVANCDHLAKLKFFQVLPFAFTEHGATQAANVLASPQVVKMGIFVVLVVRAFVRTRELASVHADLAKRLAELEQKTEGLARTHDTFSRNTRAQLKNAQTTHRGGQPAHHAPDPPKRPIGVATKALDGIEVTLALHQQAKVAANDVGIDHPFCYRQRPIDLRKLRLQRLR